MRTQVPDKLLTIVEEIDAQGSASLTRLSDVAVRRSLGVTLEELASEDWRKLVNAHRESFSQALGRAVAEAGGHGLLARSAAVSRGLNVAIFTQQVTPTTRLSVVEGEALAKWVGKTNG